MCKNAFTRPAKCVQDFFFLSAHGNTCDITSLRTLATDKNYNNKNRLYFHRDPTSGFKSFANILFSCWTDGEGRKLLATNRIMHNNSRIIIIISNGNRTERSTIQGVIGRVISNLKLRTRLPLNCTTRSHYQLIVSITKCEKLFKSAVEERLSKSKENIPE